MRLKTDIDAPGLNRDRSENEGDMKKTVVGTAVAVAWCLVAPFAQEQQRAPAPQDTPAHNVFVLSGCLKAGTDATAAFKLTDASSIGQRTPAEAAGAVGTSGRKTTTYELRPVTGVNAQGLDADALRKHLGQRVEVVVRPVESAAPPAAGLAVAQAAKPIEPAAERFTATEIKRVIGSCL
jgi:hypothetical protein